MSWFKKTPPPPAPIIVFNIGGASVSGLVLSGDDKKLHFEYKQDLPFVSGSDFNLLSNTTTRAVREVSNKLKPFSGPDSRVHCLLSSNWHVADTRKMRLTKKGSDSNLVSDIVKEGLKRHLDTYASNGYELTTMDSLILGLELDGIKQNELKFDTDGEKIVHHFASSSDKQILKNISRSIADGLGSLATPQFHSGILSTFAIIRDTLKDYDNFAILDINGELTDIIIVRKQMIADIASVPIGTKTLARRIADTTGQNIHSAYSALKLVGEDLLQNHNHHNFSSDLSDIKNEWVYAVSSILEQHESPAENLPLVVVGDDKSAVLLGEWARLIPEHQSIIANGEFLAGHYPKLLVPSRQPAHLIAQLFTQNYLWYTNKVLLIVKIKPW